MEVILLQDLEHVGTRHELVKVKAGYGRNYLIPNKMAVLATKSNKKQLAEMMRRAEARREQLMAEVNEIAGKFEGKKIQLGAKVGTTGKIFGSITSIQLAEAIKKQFDVDVDRKGISFDDDIKELGTYSAKVNLQKIKTINVEFEVVAE